MWHDYPNRRIIYQDSMGNWDELLHEGGRFTAFAPARPALLRRAEQIIRASGRTPTVMTDHISKDPARDQFKIVRNDHGLEPYPASNIKPVRALWIIVGAWVFVAALCYFLLPAEPSQYVPVYVYVHDMAARHGLPTCPKINSGHLLKSSTRVVTNGFVVLECKYSPDAKPLMPNEQKISREM